MQFTENNMSLFNAKVLKKLRDNNEPIIITQRGRAAAVIIGVEAYEKSEHDRDPLAFG
jgi:prevent-host-death family protein